MHKLLRNFIMRKQKETTCGIGKSTTHDIIVSEEYKDMIMEETSTSDEEDTTDADANMDAPSDVVCHFGEPWHACDGDIAKSRRRT